MVCQWQFGAINPASLLAFTCITIAPQRRPMNSRACATRRHSARVGTWLPPPLIMPAPQIPKCAGPIAPPSTCANRSCRTATSLRSVLAPRCCITRRWDAAGAVPRPSFLIDAGAQFRGYASDITRTHAARTGVDAQFLELCSARWMRCSCSCVHPCSPVALSRRAPRGAHRLIADLLCRSGVIVGF